MGKAPPTYNGWYRYSMHALVVLAVGAVTFAMI